jgi:hypothetical protein
MTPATIIREAQSDGVKLALSLTGTIKASGDGAAVSRWLPAIREQKAGIVEALKVGAGDTATDPMTPADVRIGRVIDQLRGDPGLRFAVEAHIDADPDAVILTLAIRGKAACELRMPKEKYDPFLLLDLIERHSGKVH